LMAVVYMTESVKSSMPMQPPPVRLLVVKEVQYGYTGIKYLE